ncbi:MAG: glycosyltransferase family 2 protein [Deltaproteobacteria bacterium]|nr:MAG: glycosyltransferase family 2 protein [Deltaproteobacteria bacterium]
MFEGKSVCAIIPALDESQTIGDVVAGIDRTIVDRVIVADNGSSDGTAGVAASAGAEVVFEPRRGYGSACMAAMRTCSCDITVFLDGDGSDPPAAIPRLLKAMKTCDADIVIGSRVLGLSGSGALTPIQRFGNWLTCELVGAFWKYTYTDLGPFRAASREALEKLGMCDPDYGWTIEMQVKAARLGLKVCEVPVRALPRQGGKSKVSGTISGSYRAGKRILGYVLSQKLAELGLRRG